MVESGPAASSLSSIPASLCDLGHHSSSGGNRVTRGAKVKIELLKRGGALSLMSRGKVAFREDSVCWSVGILCCMFPIKMTAEACLYPR